jgi:Flp pilus assembly pilin Flp
LALAASKDTLLEERCIKMPKGAEPNMKTFLHNFVKDEQGQDLIEYTLLLAFVCLASAALFISAGGSVGGIWSATNSRLAAANASAS